MEFNSGCNGDASLYWLFLGSRELAMGMHRQNKGLSRLRKETFPGNGGDDERLATTDTTTTLRNAAPNCLEYFRVHFVHLDLLGLLLSQPSWAASRAAIACSCRSRRSRSRRSRCCRRSMVRRRRLSWRGIPGRHTRRGSEAECL